MKTLLLNYLLEASVCQTVFYALYALVLRNERFFAYNRVFILFSLLLSLLIPVMEIPLSQEAIYATQQQTVNRYIAYVPLDTAEKQVVSVASQVSQADSTGIWNYILYGYSIITFIVGLRLFFQVRYLYSLAKGGMRKEEYMLIPTAGKLPTFSFFHCLFWDDTQQLSAMEETLILQHELVHIRQKHSWDSLWLEIVKVFFWFHPVIYLFKKALQEVHEYLADQAVLENYNREKYVSLLARQSLPKFPASLRILSISLKFINALL